MDSRSRNGIVGMFLAAAASLVTLLLELPLVVPILLLLGGCLLGVHVVRNSLHRR
ncbi:hypothetical protein V1227_05130 [Lentzea sp. DG1S-22]|uniref:hypothetical protein n=1 Tax=Lentzea sp. DG1S-22 TaxID=3108822 RepID=UPI002E7632E6|nr:hypothetical protein [Lentzea sp. DG1S-22]WVH82141.1 hypothetical protein V1227_05130 [Lentzea sp. DG1S-22]